MTAVFVDGKVESIETKVGVQKSDVRGHGCLGNSEILRLIVEIAQVHNKEKKTWFHFLEPGKEVIY